MLVTNYIEKMYIGQWFEIRLSEFSDRGYDYLMDIIGRNLENYFPKDPQVSLTIHKSNNIVNPTFLIKIVSWVVLSSGYKTYKDYPVDDDDDQDNIKLATELINLMVDDGLFNKKLSQGFYIRNSDRNLESDIWIAIINSSMC